MKKIIIINGPNLNLLGKRELETYGNKSFESYMKELVVWFPNVELTSFQSNVEGELVNALHDAQATCTGVIFNPGGYSHTSVALRDAVEAISIPTVEVHLSNIHAREGFRQKSLTAQAARACLSGLGLQGYLAALESLIAEG